MTGVKLEWLDPNEAEYAFVYMEVLRDLTADDHPTWDRTIVEQRTVVHEIGHQFGLGDPDSGFHNPPDAQGNPRDLMWAASSDAEEALRDDVPWKWLERDILTIRRDTKSP